jgi:hypothetical protein
MTKKRGHTDYVVLTEALGRPNPVGQRRVVLDTFGVGSCRAAPQMGAPAELVKGLGVRRHPLSVLGGLMGWRRWVAIGRVRT